MARIFHSSWSLPLLGTASFISVAFHASVVGGAALGIWNWVFSETPNLTTPPTFEVQFRPDSAASPERDPPILEVLPPEVPEPLLIEWEEAPFDEPETEVKLPSFVSVSSGFVEAEPDPDACPPPVYPRSARRLGLEGVVRVWVLVRVDGTVQDLGIEASSGHEALDRASISAISKWKFFPAEDPTGEIASRTIIQIRFQY
ncbi:MAG: energy transducer TonB [Planctomycetota bacterium]|jgi:protein TonB|nr:energy transducer TonB [Planctomycetota bacterium]